jgi:hypothetical protein
VATFTQSVQNIPRTSGLVMKHALAAPVDVFITHATLAALSPVVPAWTICHVPGGGSSPAAGAAAAARAMTILATRIAFIRSFPFAVKGGNCGRSLAQRVVSSTLRQELS